MIRAICCATVVAVSLAALPIHADAAVSASLALRLGIPRLELKDAKLEAVIDRLRTITNCNIIVNWKALDEAGVTKETPITLTIADVSLRKTLNLVLDEASATAELAILVDGNVIRVTTQAEADKHMITRIYPVGDLLLHKNNSLDVPNLMTANNAQNQNYAGGIGGNGTTTNGPIIGNTGGGGGLFGNTNNNNTNNTNNTNNSSNSGNYGTTDYTKERETGGQALVDLVEGSVRPEIWDKNGGKATCRYFDSNLIITAPMSVQEAIGGPITNVERRFGW